MSLLVATMVKDENPRIIKTLKTVLDHIDTFVVLDTGSTDGTIEEIKNCCGGKKLFIYEKLFEDFSTSRNFLLEKCEGLSDFILMLDANDEVHHIEEALEYLKKADPEKGIFYCRMHIFNDTVQGKDVCYSKTPLFRNHASIRYKYPVHEQLYSMKFASDFNFQNSKFYISQDRNEDKSSAGRYRRDLDVLLRYVETHGYEFSPVFYICQTLSNLREHEQLFKWATILTKEFDRNYYCEWIYLGYIYLGGSSEKLNHTNFHKYYIKAYNYSKRYCERAEPLYMLSTLMIEKGEHQMAYVLLKKVCEIPVPPKDKSLGARISYVVYDKLRWDALKSIQVRIKPFSL